MPINIGVLACVFVTLEGLIAFSVNRERAQPVEVESSPKGWGEKLLWRHMIPMSVAG